MGLMSALCSCSESDNKVLWTLWKEMEENTNWIQLITIMKTFNFNFNLNNFLFNLILSDFLHLRCLNSNENHIE